MATETDDDNHWQKQHVFLLLQSRWARVFFFFNYDFLTFSWKNRLFGMCAQFHNHYYDRKTYSYTKTANPNACPPNQRHCSARFHYSSCWWDLLLPQISKVCNFFEILKIFFTEFLFQRADYRCSRWKSIRTTNSRSGCMKKHWILDASRCKLSAFVFFHLETLINLHMYML